MKHLIISVLLILVSSVCFSQSPILWEKTYGGSVRDLLASGIITSDGHFLLVGYVESGDGDFSSNRGQMDMAIIKVDTNGNKIWAWCYGGIDDDSGINVVEGPNNRYYIAGSTFSNEIDVTGNHGARDAWAICIDQNGQIVWSHCFGGTLDDRFNDVTYANGKLLFVGSTRSVNGNVSFNHGVATDDVWLVETDTTGLLLREKCFGGSAFDKGQAITMINDSMPVILAEAKSADFDLDTNYGNYDAWVFCLNPAWGFDWKTTIGGSLNENMGDIIRPNSSTIAILGYTGSDDGDALNHHGLGGQNDVWLVELSNSGTVLFRNCYGGGDHELARRFEVTPDGGYILAAEHGAANGDVINYPDTNGDIWLLKLDAQKNVQWSRCYGADPYLEKGRFVIPLDWGGYILGGEDNIFISPGHEYQDWLLMKFDISVGLSESPSIEKRRLKVFPNPAYSKVSIDLATYELEGPIKIIIYNQIGSAVLTKRIESSSGIESFDISTLHPGIYILSIEAQQAAVNGKFIICR